MREWNRVKQTFEMVRQGFNYRPARQSVVKWGVGMVFRTGTQDLVWKSARPDKKTLFIRPLPSSLGCPSTTRPSASHQRPSATASSSTAPVSPARAPPSCPASCVGAATTPCTPSSFIFLSTSRSLACSDWRVRRLRWLLGSSCPLFWKPGLFMSSPSSVSSSSLSLTGFVLSCPRASQRQAGEQGLLAPWTR